MKRNNFQSTERIDIREEVSVPGTDMVLEAGDYIRVESSEEPVREAVSLEKVMAKVAKGQDLTSEEEQAVETAAEAMNDEDEDMADRIMDKVRKGQDLTDDEEIMLGNYIDASKNESTDREDREIVEISQEFKLPGTNVVLEAGDRIEVTSSKRELEEALSLAKQFIFSRGEITNEGDAFGIGTEIGNLIMGAFREMYRAPNLTEFANGVRLSVQEYE